ncbi:MAG: HAMP domain-containing sensor histidine kinase [Actinomycetota bacterium]
MRSLLRSLRVRFALLTFAAIYLPVLILLLATVITEQDTTVSFDGAQQVEQELITTRPSPFVLVTAIGLAPVAAAAAWWLAGRAVAPVEEAIGVQRQLIEEASHELRTPLAVLTGNADVLLADPDPTIDLLRDGVARSGVAARRMAATIDGLLVDARGRARTIARRPADLVALARDVTTELQPLASDRRVEIAAPQRAGAGPVEVAVDEPSIRRAVANLVTNAIEHAPPGTTVDVTVTTTGDEVRIVIVDAGPGIAGQDRERIFDRFWTGRADGTGLGLSMARQIAMAHGGTVTVDSPIADHGGTRATLIVSR